MRSTLEAPFPAAQIEPDAIVPHDLSECSAAFLANEHLSNVISIFDVASIGSD
jgi:hypothetical protein